MATTEFAEVWNVTSRDYHADTEHTSNSMLKVLDESPAKFYARFVAKTMQGEETKAMRIGSLVHCAVLEPDRWARDYCVFPECDRRTKEGKAIYADFCEQAAGKAVVDAAEHELARKIREAAYGNEAARPWLEMDGQREHSIRWQHDATGLMLKSRRDLVTANGVIVDLKTCSDVPSPKNFARQAATLRYYRQAAFYVDGQRALVGDCRGFVFIVVCSQPPFDVGLYELDSADLDRGRKENEALLSDLAQRNELDDWEPSFSREVNKLSLPRWLDYQSEYEVK